MSSLAIYRNHRRADVASCRRHSARRADSCIWPTTRTTGNRQEILQSIALAVSRKVTCYPWEPQQQATKQITGILLFFFPVSFSRRQLANWRPGSRTSGKKSEFITDGRIPCRRPVGLQFAADSLRYCFDERTNERRETVFCTRVPRPKRRRRRRQSDDIRQPTDVRPCLNERSRDGQTLLHILDSWPNYWTRWFVKIYTPTSIQMGNRTKTPPIDQGEVSTAGLLSI